MKNYASVVVGGRVVAKIDNQGGWTVYSDAAYQKLKDKIAPDHPSGSGPNMAQAVAEKIATLLGGRIEKASTALSQQQYNALPPIPQSWIDYQAVRDDPGYLQIQKEKEGLADMQRKRAEYLAQQQSGQDVQV